MIRHLRCFVAIAGTLLLNGVNAQQEPSLDAPVDRISYAIGVDMARNFKKQEVAINPDLLLKGLRDGLAGGAIGLSEKDLRRTMNGFQSDVRQKMAQGRRLAIEDNRRAGTTFLEQNKRKEGVVVLPSGLQYKVLKAGEGRKPVDSDLVECHYRGTLLNGSEFDATEPGKTAALKVSALINGWKEALKLMPVGSTWQIFVPSALAYGERGAGSEIGPNETLIFEVELVGIK
jgi:FKBP-type peptidyl-prolyl cis-trans isomerase